MPKSQQQPMRPPTPFERLADPEGRRRSADPKLTANGAVRAGRAAQFMPFAALTGYFELVRKQEITVEPKCELTEEKALELSKKLEGLKRGDLVRVTYYDTYGYRAQNVANALNALDGVWATVTYADHTARVRSKQPVDRGVLETAVKDAGYYVMTL